jgi:hypothetical protein
VASVRLKSGRKAGINPVPIVIYVVVAMVVAGGMYAWDLQFRRAEEARRRPPEPEVIARSLVENVVGAGTVKEVKIDKTTKTLSITFESALFKPEKPKKELRELLEAESTLATQAVLAQLRDVEKVSATLTAGGKTLATAEAARGNDRVLMTYVDERVKE